MIQVDSITIREFRGIRNLTLDFRGANFAVCGPNGTGKSGIVDALEFALTGSVSRLTGEGSGDVSLAAHGPHVDLRSNPERAVVLVKATLPALNKKVEIERNVKHPNRPKITPSTPEILEALSAIATHPEIVLSRREIIRYVLATPGKRSQEVQALLRLQEVEKTRAALQKIANASARELRLFEAGTRVARDDLLRALSITELRKADVLSASNERRRVLGLPVLADLTDTTALNDGLAATIAAPPQRISKVQATTDHETLQVSLAKMDSTLGSQEFAACHQEIQAILKDPTTTNTLAYDRFYAAGVELIEQGACPFCDVEWDMDELRSHIAEKRRHLAEVSHRLGGVNTLTSNLTEILRDVSAALRSYIRYAGLCQPVIADDDTFEYLANLDQIARHLNSVISLRELRELLQRIVVCPSGIRTTVTQIHEHVLTLPDPSRELAARDWLIRAQEKMEVYKNARRRESIARARAGASKMVADIFTATSDRVLTELYTAVQDDFVKLYRFINRDDEAGFKANLTPSLGKLGFDVDFYGRGFFPPGAYHSEGHQDGMGLCLYLALMRHVQGDGFRFAVLDDVLMSVDSGHRREVCALLKKEFSGTQFVMTTHDPIWLKHMGTEGLTGPGAHVQFRRWSVGSGPTLWDDRDVWAEIHDYLTNNDVRSAAALLRHYLEYMGGELCHRLRAPVEFRGDAQYQLGDLLPRASAQLGKLLDKAKSAAKSWEQQLKIDEAAALDATFSAAARASQMDQWQINPAVHYNEWENLGKTDFEPVVKAFRALIQAFRCSGCADFLRASPERGKTEALRCRCGAVNLNLLSK
jgi:hypothetical protein